MIGILFVSSCIEERKALRILEKKNPSIIACLKVLEMLKARGKFSPQQREEADALLEKLRKE